MKNGFAFRYAAKLLNYFNGAKSFVKDLVGHQQEQISEPAEPLPVASFVFTLVW
jgi:hypothetical protein